MARGAEPLQDVVRDVIRSEFEELRSQLREDIREEFQRRQQPSSSGKGEGPVLKFRASPVNTSVAAREANGGYQPHQWMTRHLRRYSVTQAALEQWNDDRMVGVRSGQPIRTRSGAIQKAFSSNSIRSTRTTTRSTQRNRLPSAARSTARSTKTSQSSVTTQKSRDATSCISSASYAHDSDTESLRGSKQTSQVTPMRDSGGPAAPVAQAWDSSPRSSIRPSVTGGHGKRYFRTSIDRTDLQLTQKAMGLNRANTDSASATPHSELSCRAVAEDIVHSIRFEYAMMFLIFVNCVTVGTQIDYMAHNLLTHPPVAYQVTDILFCSCFVLELALRFYVHRRRFFDMWGWGWNVLDLIVALANVAEEVLETITHSSSGVGLRTIRILRTLSLLRILRLMRFTEDLRLLVTCILISVRSFLWALMFLFLLIYIFAVYLTQSVHLYRLENSSGPQTALELAGIQELMKWYGSIPQASLSLFEAISGGVDWNDIVRPLMEHLSPIWGLLVVVWIAFSILAVLNIITGNFVQNAIEQSKNVREQDRITQARRLFHCLDVDESGLIRRNEIGRHLDSQAVQDFFRLIDVDTSEAESLFDLLDVSGDGHIDFEEFLSGVLRLQGQAKALDMIMLILDTRHGFEQLAGMLQTLSTTISQMHEERQKGGTSVQQDAVSHVSAEARKTSQCRTIDNRRSIRPRGDSSPSSWFQKRPPNFVDHDTDEVERPTTQGTVCERPTTQGSLR